jgi:tRNA(fMet)-specific endonuclease VapC
MTYILDTNTCIFWLKDVGNVRQQVNAHVDDKITTNIICLAELYFGVENSAEQHREHNRTKLDDLIAAIGYVGFSKAAAKHFGEQKARLRKLGQPIADLDLLIASIALAEDAILVTDNLKHFERISELRLENWK